MFESGLLLDLDDLLPETAAAKAIFDASPPLSATGTPMFRPLPENPHALVDAASPTFELAVSMYRAQLVELSMNHDRRNKMGQAAALDASSRSWHGAMEMLVDGYREISLPLPSPRPSLSLSRTPTLDESFDVVSHCALVDEQPYAESSAASPRTRRLGVGRVLRLGGVFRRTGGKLKDGSISSIPGNVLFWKRSGTESKPRLSWLGKKDSTGVQDFAEQVDGLEGVLGQLVSTQSNQVWATRTFSSVMLGRWKIF